MADLSKCKAKEHPLIAVYIHTAPMTEDVVRWCPECGAVVVDKDYDGRTNPGWVRKMQLPEISKEALSAPKDT